MPRIKRSDHPITPEFRALHREAAKANETNDCVVKMFALATGFSYERSLTICNSYGRKPRDGMYPYDWKKALVDYGVSFKRVPARRFIDQYPKAHRILKGVTTHHPDRFKSVWQDGKRYILVTQTHVAFVENGVVHDWSRGRALRVVEILELKEAE